MRRLMKCDVRTPEQALEYMIDCTLATVSHMASLKSRKKSEFERQITIAQTGIDWMVHMKVEPHKTRVEDVIAMNQSVKEWADGQVV